jgi:hypothetical protein
MVAAHGEGPGIRQATAEYTISLASQGVRSSVVRLPPTNHGDGDNGFIAFLVGIARDKGVSAYIGDGANRWPAVHRLDSGRLFRLAVEQAPAGSTLHAVAEEGVPIRDIAEVIGRHLDLPVVSISPDEAGEHFTWMAGFLGADSPASSALTQELLDWHPTHPGLIEDLDEGHYFRDVACGCCLIEAAERRNANASNRTRDSSSSAPGITRFFHVPTSSQKASSPRSTAAEQADRLLLGRIRKRSRWGVQ